MLGGTVERSVVVPTVDAVCVVQIIDVLGVIGAIAASERCLDSARDSRRTGTRMGVGSRV